MPFSRLTLTSDLTWEGSALKDQNGEIVSAARIFIEIVCRDPNGGIAEGASIEGWLDCPESGLPFDHPEQLFERIPLFPGTFTVFRTDVNKSFEIKLLDPDINVNSLVFSLDGIPMTDFLYKVYFYLDVLKNHVQCYVQYMIDTDFDGIRDKETVEIL